MIDEVPLNFDGHRSHIQEALMSIVKREKQRKREYQGDRQGRPYNTTALPVSVL